MPLVNPGAVPFWLGVVRGPGVRALRVGRPKRVALWPRRALS